MTNAYIFTRQLWSFLDIDECVTGQNLCPFNRRCVNTFGSYYCKCQNGYDLKYVDGKYDCVGKEKGQRTNCSIIIEITRTGLMIGRLAQFQMLTSVSLGTISAATMLNVSTLKDRTNANARKASEAVALTA